MKGYMAMKDLLVMIDEMFVEVSTWEKHVTRSLCEHDSLFSIDTYSKEWIHEQEIRLEEYHEVILH